MRAPTGGNTQRWHFVVVDDPESIVRCTNKIYLADLFIGVGDQHPEIVAGPQAFVHFPIRNSERKYFCTKWYTANLVPAIA